MDKDDFKKKIHDLLDELGDRISELDSKADAIADNAKEEYHKQLENLKALREKLSAKMGEYEDVSEGKWSIIKEAAGEFAASVADAWKEGYGKVADAFKKEED